MKQTGEIKGGQGITWEQFFMLNGLWRAACQRQNWNDSDRSLRLAKYGEALGRRIESAKDLGWSNDVDRVKNFLTQLATAPSPPPTRRGLLSAATRAMLDALFFRAVQTHCRLNALERISAAAVEDLRQEWLHAALGEGGHDWDYLTNRDVDRLKPFLIWQADPDNETKRAAVATADVDGRTRVVISALLEKVLRLRQIHFWLVREFEAVDLSPETLDQYVHDISEDTRSRANWRALLLPILEQVMMTVEERRREHVRLFKLMYGEDFAKDLLKFLDDFPDQYAAITTKYVVNRPLMMTLASARLKRGEDRSNKRGAVGTAGPAVREKPNGAPSGRAIPRIGSDADKEDPFTTGQTPF